jgi:ATP adenylyltransferase
VETPRNFGREVLSDCIFCGIQEERVVSETSLFIVVRDLFPVSHLHTLIIPKRHVETYFDLDTKELSELNDVLQQQRVDILRNDNTVSGFNIGINVGEDAGQTISHCHVHLIPRRKGDTPNPQGGVRGVIAGKQKYK